MGLVELCRADGGHLIGPAGKAVDVGVIAGNARGQEQPQDQRSGRQQDHHPAIEPRLPLRRPAVLSGHCQHRQHVQTGKQHERLCVAVGHGIGVRGGDAGLLLGHRREVCDLNARRSGLHRGHFKVVKPGAAGVFAAVSAHAGKYGQRGLFRAGAAIQLQQDPFAVGGGQFLGIAEGVLDGDRGARAILADVLRLAHAGDAI